MKNCFVVCHHFLVLLICNKQSINTGAKFSSIIMILYLHDEVSLLQTDLDELIDIRIIIT